VNRGRARHRIQVRRQLKAPAALPQSKSPRYHLDRKLSVPHNWTLWRRKNLFPLLRIEHDSLAVQPVARRHTDWAIPARSTVHCNSVTKQSKRLTSFTETREFCWIKVECYVAIQSAFTHIRAFRENYTQVEVLLRDIFVSVFIKEGSRDSAVGIVTGYGLGEGGVGVWVPVKSIVFSPRRPYRLRGQPKLLYSGYQGLSPRIKRPGRKVDHSPPTSAEVKKMWIYTSTLRHICG
jgi:hypothetical protein